MEETTGFLETVFGAYGGEGWLEIRCLTAALGTLERSVPRRWFPLTKNGLCDAGQWAVRQAKDWNVYYGVLPRSEAGQGGADATFSTAWLWCDIDNSPTWNHAAALLEKAELPPPRLAVCSGNGCHVYWQLAARACLPTAETKAAFRGLLKRLCAKIGGEPNGPRADPASTDAARILRLPGTFNWKDAANPKPVKIVHWNREGLRPVGGAVAGASARGKSAAARVENCREEAALHQRSPALAGRVANGVSASERGAGVDVPETMGRRRRGIGNGGAGFLRLERFSRRRDG